MQKFRLKLLILFLLTVISFGTVSHADSNKPKDIRILYVSEKGKELEHFDYKVYAVQQVFLDKMAVSSYIDPDGYEYNTTGYRVKTWPERGFGGTPSEDVPAGYYAATAELGKIFSSQTPPWSLQISIVLHANGAKYPTENLVRILWLNQSSELVKEEQRSIKRGESYTDEVPSGYDIVSVSASMMDIWNISNEITIDPAHPTVAYNKFGQEFSIIYRMNLTDEQAAEIKSGQETAEGNDAAQVKQEAEAKPPENTDEPENPPAQAESGSASSGINAPETAATKAVSQTETEKNKGGETIPPTEVDESYTGTSSRITLILGCVIGVAVIYLLIISIGMSRRNKRRRNKRL